MEKNIGLFGRIVRILVGFALLYAAIKVAGRKWAPAMKVALGVGVAGFVLVAQGWHGVCLLRAIGVKTKF